MHTCHILILVHLFHHGTTLLRQVQNCVATWEQIRAESSLLHINIRMGKEQCHLSAVHFQIQPFCFLVLLGPQQWSLYHFPRETTRHPNRSYNGEALLDFQAECYLIQPVCNICTFWHLAVMIQFKAYLLQIRLQSDSSLV